jgi:pimeloyl-ACP methyl ester carboxylesterase
MRSGQVNFGRHREGRRVWTLQRPGARLTYTAGGSGPAVLLIQGVGVAGGAWLPQIDGLHRRHDVVAFDNRGIDGLPFDEKTLSIETMAQDALAIMDARRVDRFHVVGHSMGGLIAQELALTAPDRVRSLALLCTFESGKQGARPHAGMIVTALRTRIGTRRMRRHAFLELLMSRSMLETVPRDLLAEYMRLLLGRDLADQPPIIMKQLRAMGRYDASARLSRLGSIPTLVLSAHEDRIALPRFGRALAAAIPGSRYIEMADAAHGVTIQRAHEINEILMEHFAEADAPRLLTAAS